MRRTQMDPSRRALLSLAWLGGTLGLAPAAHAAGPTLLNVSHDVSREFYKDYNAVFAAHWKKTTGEDLTLNPSHGGGSPQARAVVDGLDADDITMNQANDIDILAWGAGVENGVGAEAARALVQGIFANVPVLDGGGRAATTTFAQRNVGDALVTFESEVPLIERAFGGGDEVVSPGRTILAENPVSVRYKVIDKKDTRKQAEACLQFLDSRHPLRPRSGPVLATYTKDFPKVSTFTVDEVFGGWTRAQKQHVDDGGLYDPIVAANAKK